MGRAAAAAAPRAKRRRTEQAAAVDIPLPDAAGEGDGVDRISSLPDALLGEIISLLPTKDGARTQVIASRWRSLWLSAPLNLDESSLTTLIDTVAVVDIMTRILAAHPGPVRRLSVSVDILLHGPDTLVAWLGSPAFDNLQELELGVRYMSWWQRQALPAFRFSAALRVVTFAHCSIPPAAVEHLLLPQLGHLGLEGVTISGNTLERMIAGCPALRYLLLNEIHGFGAVRINSRSLVCIGMCYNDPYSLQKLIIEDAPSLERLVQLPYCRGLQVSLISAPKLETLGCLTAYDLRTVFQNLRAASFVEMCRIKVLAVDVNSPESMDTFFDLLRWFPCLEKLHIELPSMYRRGRYLLRHNDVDETECLDSNLKSVVVKGYRGTKAHVKFATLFILNAKRLEEMRIEVVGFMSCKKCAAERRRLGQLFKKRASSAAQLCVTVRRCYKDITHVKHVHDLSKANPFDCTC